MTDGQAGPVRTKAVLVDPESMTTIWLNESADADSSTSPGEIVGSPLEQAMPMAATLGVLKAVREVADTGEPQHLSTDLVSTRRGSVAIATSVYLLPDRNVLVLTEQTWHAEREEQTAHQR